MTGNVECLTRRVLIIDDNPEIHLDIRKILAGDKVDRELDELEDALFGRQAAAGAVEVFDIESAYQGQEGFELVKSSVANGREYDLAIVDMRMPPGWDGLETIEHLWRADGDLQIIICTAFSDHGWDEITARLGIQDRFLILKKPFDDCELQQMVRSLSEKRNLLKEIRSHLKKARLRAAASVKVPTEPVDSE